MHGGAVQTNVHVHAAIQKTTCIKTAFVLRGVRRSGGLNSCGSLTQTLCVCSVSNEEAGFPMLY